MEAALAEGFAARYDRSDLHRFNVDGPVFDLVTTLSKFLHLGMPLPEVISQATLAPAVALRRQDQFGSLTVGASADVAVLRLEEGEFAFTDLFQVTTTGRQRLMPLTTLKNGRRVRSH